MDKNLSGSIAIDTRIVVQLKYSIGKVKEFEDWLGPDVVLWQITFRHNGYELKDLKSKKT